MKTIMILLLLFFIDVEILLSQEVAFVQQDKKLSRYGYQSVTKTISIGTRKHLSYEEYVGKKGKIIGVRSNGISDFYEIKLENGETVFQNIIKVNVIKEKGNTI